MYLVGPWGPICKNRRKNQLRPFPKKTSNWSVGTSTNATSPCIRLAQTLMGKIMFSMMRWFLGSKFLRSSPYLKPSVVHVYNEHLTPRPELLAPALPASLRNQRVAVDSCRCPLVNQHNYGKSAFLMGKLTINGHVQQLMLFYQRVLPWGDGHHLSRPKIQLPLRQTSCWSPMATIQSRPQIQCWWDGKCECMLLLVKNILKPKLLLVNICFPVS